MTVAEAVAPAAAASDEALLARRAAAGDGQAFAELYGRYERRAYNLCYRILGSPDEAADATQEAFLGVLRRLPSLQDRELAFGSYLFTSARNACYDLIEKRKRAEPRDEIPEHATPVGSGAGGGGAGFDPGDPGDDPERNVLLAARQEEIRAANATLPERQREALALKELEDLSYDEIAEIMGMNRNSVAQLISRARINLRDALRGSALASIAASSEDCSRALPLIAAREDGQLAPDSDEARWLYEHMVACDTCRVSVEAMAEAGVSYRAWVPIAAAPFLFRETMAKAAELVGADWSDVAASREPTRALEDALPGADVAARVPIVGPIIAAVLAIIAAVIMLVALMAGELKDSQQSAQAVDPGDRTAVVADDDDGDDAAAPAKKKAVKPKKHEAAAGESGPKGGGSDGAAQDTGGGSPGDGAAVPVRAESDGGGTAHKRATERPDEGNGGSSGGGNGGGDGGRSGGGGNGGGDRGQPGGGGDGGGETTPGGDVPAFVAPDPPPDTTPETPTDPPRTGPTGCRDAAGVPITCPPRRPTCRDPLTGRPITCPPPRAGAGGLTIGPQQP